MFEEKDVTPQPNGEQGNNPLEDNQGTPTEVTKDDGSVTQDGFLNIKYNKEDKVLTQEEAIELAQKGMNYEKVLAERDSLKESVENSKSRKLVEKLAQAQGMTVDEFVDTVEKEKELKVIKEELKITDKDALEKAYQDRKDAEVTRTNREKERLEKEQKEQSLKDTNEFLEFYKERYGKVLEVESIPQEVFEMTKQGMTMKDAFTQHRLNELEHKQGIINLNQENANSTTGPIGDGAPVVNEFSQERIDGMSENEMAKHWTNPKFREAMGLGPL